MKGSAAGTEMIERHGKLAILDTAKIRRTIIAGDIHGDLHAFKRIISIGTTADVTVFLGDYADRGSYGLEVIEGLMAAVKRSRNRIVALKGNHEDFMDSGAPRFHPCTLVREAEQKGRNWKELFPVLQEFFDTLPLAALIPGYALLVHGGISEDLTSPETLEHPTKDMATDIMWSDPGQSPGQHPNPRGAGKLFGADTTAKVLSSLGVKFLIRSHEPRKARTGPHFEHRNSVVTTSATSIYGGRPFALVLPGYKLPLSRKSLSDCTSYLSQ